MKKSISSLSDSFNTIRTGRASAAILDKIVVEVAGAPMALKAVAQVCVWGGGGGGEGGGGHPGQDCGGCGGGGRTDGT